MQYKLTTPVSKEDLAPLRAEKRAMEREIRAQGERIKPALMEARRALAVREDQLELEVRGRLTRELLAWKDLFLANMDAIGHLDLILAKARLAREQAQREERHREQAVPFGQRPKER